MSGHSHWAGIKHKKEIADKKRGQIFSKLLAAITAAARGEPNPEFNPRLRTAVQKAKDASVPTENISRAIKRASEPGGAIEELEIEAYGPGGVAILIEAATDNKNRTISEVKKILNGHGAKWAEPGSVRWAFEKSADEHGRWSAKFTQELNKEDKDKLEKFLGALDEHNDVQGVYTNAKSEA